jgi:[protein-PII] uridylyltransferase
MATRLKKDLMMKTLHRVETHTGLSLADRLSADRLALFADISARDAVETLSNHSALIDAYIMDSFEASRIGPKMDFIANPYAIVALGGYGRAEQCVHSDVDLLFLFQKKVPSAAEELIREIVYPLWDLKMEVGYATRSIDESLTLAGEDYEILTSILDARFICGSSAVFAKLREQFRRKIISRHADRIIAWLVDRNRKRHQDFGDSTYMLQPNLKEGNGGLRDYHTLRWIAMIRYDVQQTRDLEFQGCMSHQEYNDLMAALSFIWAVRNQLHLAARRKCDQLYFEYQHTMADVMGFPASDGQTAVERFLGALHNRMSFIKHQLQLFLYEIGYNRKGKWLRKIKKISTMPGLHLDRGQLHFDSPEAILVNPELLIQIFEASAELKLPLSREALRLVREFDYLVNDAFIRSPSVRNAFEKILLTPATTFNVLEQMLNTGFLIRLIPEYADIADRVQYDAYHLFPVDRHMLKTVYTIKTFGTPDSPCPEELCDQLFPRLKRKKILLWAALLHDIGKGRPGGKHSATGAEMAGEVMMRMGYASHDIEPVVFLIEHHLLLVKTATRRDINDEETAVACARVIRDVNRLRMLYLLTVADSCATGPKAWNNWTAILIRDFFLKISNVLENEELAAASAVNRTNKKIRLIQAEAGAATDEKDLKALLTEMPPRYLLYTDVADILSHIRLFRALGDEAFAWHVNADTKNNTRTVTVCAKDRPGLFSMIAGVFTLNNINILDVQAHTWRNNIALDIFTVEPPPDLIFESERWERAAQHLRSAIAGQMDLSKELALKSTPPGPADAHVSIRPNRVEIDNKGSSFYTIIEVFAYDCKGLLFRIADAIARCGLNISVAKIATKVDQVVDVFYVRDAHDGKVDDPRRTAAVRESILSVLPPCPKSTDPL